MLLQKWTHHSSLLGRREKACSQCDVDKMGENWYKETRKLLDEPGWHLIKLG